MVSDDLCCDLFIGLQQSTVYLINLRLKSIQISIQNSYILFGAILASRSDIPFFRLASPLGGELHALAVDGDADLDG